MEIREGFWNRSAERGQMGFPGGAVASTVVRTPALVSRFSAARTTGRRRSSPSPHPFLLFLTPPPPPPPQHPAPGAGDSASLCRAALRLELERERFPGRSSVLRLLSRRR